MRCDGLPAGRADASSLGCGLKREEVAGTWGSVASPPSASPDLIASRTHSAGLPSPSQPLTEAIDPTRLWADDDDKDQDETGRRARAAGTVTCWACGGSGRLKMFDAPCFTMSPAGEVSVDELLAEVANAQDDDAGDAGDGLEAYLEDVYAAERIDAQDRLTAICL